MVIMCRSIMPSTVLWFRLGISSITSQFRSISILFAIQFYIDQSIIHACTLCTHPNVVCLLFIYCTTFKHFYCCYRDYNRRIYHLVSSPEIKVSWKELIDCGRWIIMNKLPLNGVVWYPGGSMKSNRLLHNICCIFFHWIPAILIDCLLWCLRYPPVYVKRSIEFNAISLYFIFFLSISIFFHSRNNN